MERLGDELKRGRAGPFIPNRHYKHIGDLRTALGIDAILNLECCQGEHNHKIEIIDAGTKSFSELVAIPSRLFLIDPMQLEVMRIDLAGDIVGVPVSWFRTHARFRYKQFASSIDKASPPEIEFIGMGNAVAQSLYAGRKPNCIRIYDKLAELRVQWIRLKRTYERYNKGLSGFTLTDEQQHYALLHIPIFEEFCKRQGFELEPGKIVTRVERQFGGDRIPEQLDRVNKLTRLPEYDPFDDLRIVAGAASYQTRPPIESWGGSIREYLTLIGFQTLSEERGSMHAACSFVTRHGKGNGKRVIDSVQPFLPSSAFKTTARDITRIYRESVRRQLAA